MGSTLHHLPGSSGTRSAGRRRVAGFLADVLVAAAFPQGCHVCRRPVFRRDAGIACEACWSDPLVTPLYADHTVCIRCGLPGTGRCITCAPQPLVAVRSVGEYAGALRATLLDIKRRPRVPRVLGDMLEATWRDADCLHRIDFVVPVPLHPERLKERGHNQAELLASELVRRIGISIDPHALTRRKAGSRRRIGAGRESRVTESAGAFVAARRLVTGKRVLLVDDVFTTGATLGACAVSLMEAGALEVVALTAARVRMGSGG